MSQTQTQQMDDGLNIKDIVNSITIGTPGKQYGSFKEQIMDDENIKILGGLYGKYMEARPLIEKELKHLFQDFPKSYYETLLSWIKLVGLLLDVKYHGQVTV